MSVTLRNLGGMPGLLEVAEVKGDIRQMGLVLMFSELHLSICLSRSLSQPALRPRGLTLMVDIAWAPSPSDFGLPLGRAAKIAG